MHHIPLATIYYYAKTIAAVGTSAAFIYAMITRLNAIIRKAKSTSDNVVRLMNDILPHIQASVDSHGDALRGIKSDVRDMDTKISGFDQRLGTMETGVEGLNESFLRHLDRQQQEVTIEKKEVIIKRKRKN